MANRIKLKTIGLVSLAVVILTACGQKLPLYLPKDAARNTPTPGSEPSAESAEQGTN